MKGSWSHILPGIRVEGQPYQRAHLWFDHFDIGGYLPNTAGRGGKYDETADSGEWLVTVVDGGGDNGETITVQDNVDNGITKFTTNDADNDALNLQRNGEGFRLKTGRQLLMEFRLAIVDVDKTDWLIGLAITDTTLLDGTTDGLYFRVPAGDSSQQITAVAEKSSVETVLSTGVSVTDNEYVILRMEAYELGRVLVYVNGAYTGELVTNLPLEHMTPSLHIRNAGAQANSLLLDYGFAVQDS